MPIDKLKLEETLVALNVDYVRAGVVYKIQVDSTKAVLSLIDEIKDNIKTFEVIKGTLDDVFINVIGKKYV